jgi:type VI secretion system secreted protein VgrG
MKPKSGKKIEAVKPTEPEEAFVADEADPGKVAKVKAKEIDAKKGKYGQTKAPAFKPEEATASSQDGKSSDKKAQKKEDDKETTFIDIKLTDENGNAVVGEKYEVELPDGSVSKGTLGADGTAKIKGFEPGQCKVRFPNLEDDCVSAK